MCGITGIYSFTTNTSEYTDSVRKSLHTLRFRGPDAQAIFEKDRIIFGHARLSIIDTSSAGNQPFTDNSGRYTIVFNGEFYNFQEYLEELHIDGVEFRSKSDTEVLLYLYIKYGESCIEKINGFFAFAIYDAQDQTLFAARDRMGIKPLYMYSNDTFFCFCSEMSGMMAYPIEKKINQTALFTYLQLSYTPAPYTIIEGIEKLEPGTSIRISNNTITKKKYYTIPYFSESETARISYEEAQKQLITRLEESVKLRLISDVPLGTFLSGGIDSSVISVLANKHVTKLKTFSIGFTENSFFDETYYANLVAKKIQSEHTVIPISNKDFSDTIFDVLDSIDEPFADSSAIAVYVLSKYVKPHVTVALSGDGADELFAGYNKHRAHYNLFKNSLINNCISASYPIIKHLPQSRNNSTFNLFRKINRYAEGLQLSTAETYWKWCSLNSEENAEELLKQTINKDEYSKYKGKYLSHFDTKSGIQDILYADQLLVLPNDMLTKVDRMSMAQSLEVRTPFLDYTLISFINSLPSEYKIDNNLKKKILQDSFRNELPQELYNRPKKGFEVPLYDWCKTVLKDTIEDLLSADFIEKQGIFNYEEVLAIKQKLNSNNPGDSPSQICGIIVFQYWWKKYME